MNWRGLACGRSCGRSRHCRASTTQRWLSLHSITWPPWPLSPHWHPYERPLALWSFCLQPGRTCRTCPDRARASSRHSQPDPLTLTLTTLPTCGLALRALPDPWQSRRCLIGLIDRPAASGRTGGGGVSVSTCHINCLEDEETTGGS